LLRTSSAADEDLHDLIGKRHERAATIVTGNLDFDEWDRAFACNRPLASATLDRLHHNAYYLELDGPSCRNPKVPRTCKKPSKRRPKTRQNSHILKPLRGARRRRSKWPVYADPGWPDYGDS
jgi:hypothetical protein